MPTNIFSVPFNYIIIQWIMIFYMVGASVYNDKPKFLLKL